MRKTNVMKTVVLVVFFLALSVLGCSNNKNTTASASKTFGIFTISNDGLSAEVEGTIVDATLQDFNKMIAQYPKLKTLNVVDVPGSDVSGDVQTDTALDLGREIYEKNINTHLVDDGFVASGGADLLASGKHVSVGANPSIGIHAWDGGFEGNPNGSAWDIKNDENHIEHKKYLHYYQDIGFSKQKAKDFYFFTIRAAKPSEIHTMTITEINQYLIR